MYKNSTLCHVPKSCETIRFSRRRFVQWKDIGIPEKIPGHANLKFDLEKICSFYICIHDK